MRDASASAAQVASGATLRPVTRADATRLFEWANRPDRRAVSLRNAEITWDTHIAWLTARLASPDCAFWVIEMAGTAGGWLRLERSADTAEVSIYILPDFRQQGAGATVLAAARAECVSRWPGVSLSARVRRDNPGSRRFFEKAGFVVFEEFSDHCVLRLPAATQAGR